MQTRRFIPVGLIFVVTLFSAIGYANEKIDVPGVKIGSDGTVSVPGVKVGADGSVSAPGVRVDKAGNVSVEGKNSGIAKGSCVVNGDSQNLTLNCDKKKVVINGDDNTIICDGKSQILIVNGDSNQIRFKGQCDKVQLNGEDNAVNIAKVGTINANGDNNRVTWVSALTGAKPVILSTGDNNRIAKGGLD